MLRLIDTHAERYSQYPAATRLRQLDTDSGRCARMRRSQRERAARESAIPQEDVDAAVAFIIEHPYVGAQRARMTLIDQEKALISTAFINDVKRQLADLAESTYRRRREEEKLLEAEVRARLPDSNQYDHIQALRPHHIWAIDFVFIDFLSYRLILCVVYDVYSQAYLAIEAGTSCDQVLASRAMVAAVDCAGTEPDCLRRDNGAAFLTDDFAGLLDRYGSRDAPIPPGKPWFNGSLESNNTSLKAAAKTYAMLDLPQQKKAFREARRDLPKALELLQHTARRMRTVFNDTVARPKYGVPPGKVLDKRVEESRQRQCAFVERKRRERRERMDELRRSPAKPSGVKTFILKAKRAAAKVLAKLSTDQLYVLNEAIHRRYQAVEV